MCIISCFSNWVLSIVHHTFLCIWNIKKWRVWELSRKSLRCLTMKNIKMRELEDNWIQQNLLLLLSPLFWVDEGKILAFLLHMMPSTRKCHFCSLEHVGCIWSTEDTEERLDNRKKGIAEEGHFVGTLFLLKLIGEKVMYANGGSCTESDMDRWVSA